MNNLATVQPAQTDTDLMQQYLREILLSPVYQAAVETPLDSMTKLSQRLGHNVLLKREDKQPVYSFKLRGAFHKLHKVQQQNPDARVVCASAGNHAQGVALSASKLGLNATIVMPITTPEIKVAAVRARGDEIVGHGRTNAERQGHLDEAAERALIGEATGRLSEAEGAKPEGWLGPWISHSHRTPDLLAEAGYRYLLDWCMDDQPIWFRCRGGRRRRLRCSHSSRAAWSW